MTAAERKIILDKGSDYLAKFNLVDDGGINPRDISTWAWEFIIYYVNPVDGTLSDAKSIYGEVDTVEGVNGDVDILVDSLFINSLSDVAVPQVFPLSLTGIAESNLAKSETLDLFATTYAYRYTMTVYESYTGTQAGGDITPIKSGTTRELRICRGKCAIRL